VRQQESDKKPPAPLLGPAVHSLGVRHLPHGTMQTVPLRTRPSPGALIRPGSVLARPHRSFETNVATPTRRFTLKAVASCSASLCRTVNVVRFGRSRGFAPCRLLVRDQPTMPARITLAIQKAQVSNPHRTNGNSKFERVREPDHNQTDASSPHRVLALPSAFATGLHSHRFQLRTLKTRPLQGGGVRVCARRHINNLLRYEM
jgi:hypothetical protein